MNGSPYAADEPGQGSGENGRRFPSRRELRGRWRPGVIECNERFGHRESGTHRRAERTPDSYINGVYRLREEYGGCG